MKFEKIEKVRKKLNFDFGAYSEPFGRSGGLAIWWNANSHIHVDKIGRFFIHLDEALIMESIGTPSLGFMAQTMLMPK